MLRRIAALALAVALAAVPRPALADDAADARAEYAAGTAALAKSAYREAAEHFEIAARLRPHAAAFYAAGKAWQLAGELVKSADRLSAAVERNELSPADKGDALHHLVAIEQKVGTVNVTGDASMELQIDDGPSVRPTGARHGATGKHTLFIRGARGSATREVNLNAGGSMSIELKPEMLVEEAGEGCTRAGAVASSGHVGKPPDEEPSPAAAPGLRTAAASWRWSAAAPPPASASASASLRSRPRARSTTRRARPTSTTRFISRTRPTSPGPRPQSSAPPARRCSWSPSPEAVARRRRGSRSTRAAPRFPGRF